MTGDSSGAGDTRLFRRLHGAEIKPEGGVRFRLWAPAHERMSLSLEPEGRLVPMHSTGEGWHKLALDEARAGTLYRFTLPDGLKVPDPASRFQPHDVHGPSEVIDPAAYRWTDQGWRGRPWHEAVLYELHVGTFTEEGTFRAAIGRLDHLARLGVTALEIMPIADFPGRWNWGYDGVLLYAPDSTYGRPEDFKALIEAAHQRGLMVLLDVVYNHFGPDGNYLSTYAPGFFTKRHKTPWGDAINYDGKRSKPVREFVIENALYWIAEFHLDGLRLDAVHAIVDDSPKHVLDELAERVRAEAADRHVHLVLENEENEARRLARSADGKPLHYTAQWNDDVHHVLRTAATGEDKGYYAEYLGDTEKLGRALAEGFAFQGEMMAYRGEPRGEPSADLPPTAFIAFIQNHDQVGNRAFGERITAITKPEAVRAIAAVYLLLPQVPMLFMGEEWAASQPFPFFCDFGGELADAVRKGRRKEFARFPEFKDEKIRERIPDPQAETTFASAKLRWDETGTEPHAGWLEWYRGLLAKRHAEIVPRLAGIGGNAARFELIGEEAVLVRWCLNGGEELVLAANLSATPREGFPATSGRILWQEGDAQGGRFGPWVVRWSIDQA
jgi:malto-oligosyltrehalose trehalohydrolase